IGTVPKREIVVSGLKSAVASLGMGGFVWLFLRSFKLDSMAFVQRLAVVAGAVGLGLGAYLLLSMAFHQEEMKGLKDVFSPEKILKK
ncbi:MAG: hypothetical protein ACE5LV_03290, partial [Candidatus Aminicenantales bacterium]